MINAVIIDDEPLNITNLQRLLEQYCPDVHIINTATGADKGVEIIIEHAPDLVFLDIQMPGKNGFDMLATLPHNNFALIFVTAFDQFGIQAIRCSAIDYLLKPIEVESLQLAVTKVKTRMADKHKSLLLDNLLHTIQHRFSPNEHRLALPSLKETRFVYTRDIVRCESNNSYTSFYLLGGEKITVTNPIHEYEALLVPYGFIRTHQSHLVNGKFVKSMTRGADALILLEDGAQVPVSRLKKELVRKMLS